MPANPALGVEVQLQRDANGDGSIDGPEAKTPFTTAVSDGTGTYTFTHLVPGAYRVVIPAPPVGYAHNSSQPAGADDGVDGDDTGTQSRADAPTFSPLIGLLPGQETTDDGDDANGDGTIDFGFYSPVAVGNLVWLDRDADGTLDAGEQPLAGATVEILDVDGRAVRDSAAAPVALQITGADGTYLFGNLRPGEYKVSVTPPDDSYFPSPTGADTDTNPADTDSQGVPAFGLRRVESLPFELASGVEPGAQAAGAASGAPAARSAAASDTAGSPDPNTNLTVDFAFYRLMALGDRVWLDANNNGTLDADETGLDGISMQLFYDRDSNGRLEGVEVTPYSTTVTADGGFYRFAELWPGNYLVVVPTPPAAYPTSSTPTGAGVDNDDNGVQDRPGAPVTSAWITLLAAAESTAGNTPGDFTVDFGFFRFDLALRLRVGGMSSIPLVAGQSAVTYTIEVINQGTVPAVNVQVVDYLHPGLLFDPARNPGWSAGPMPMLILPGQVEPGQSTVVQLVVGLAPAAAGQTLDNFAEILSDGSGSSILDVDSTPDGSNIEMPVKDDIVTENGKANPGVDDEDDHDVAQVGTGVFDLALRTFVSGRSEQPLRPNSLVTFTIEIFNQGDTPATGVQVVDYPPAGLVFDALANPGWSSDPNPITTIPDVIAPGAIAWAQIVFRIDPGVSESIFWNAAEITAVGGGSIDIDSTADSVNDEIGARDDVVTESSVLGGDEDDHDVAQVYVFLGGFDLALRMRLAQMGAAAVDAGRDAVFNIEIFNQGTVLARDVVYRRLFATGLRVEPDRHRTVGRRSAATWSRLSQAHSTRARAWWCRSRCEPAREQELLSTPLRS